MCVFVSMFLFELLSPNAVKATIKAMSLNTNPSRHWSVRAWNIRTTTCIDDEQHGARVTRVTYMYALILNCVYMQNHGTSFLSEAKSL